MGRNSKKFIDKKKDVVHSFKLVQRSQRDPLVADESAPQNVLVNAENSDSRKEEERKFGVYFDDDYDYLQHLRGTKESVEWEEFDVEVYTIKDELSEKCDNSGLVLPSSVFESHVEEPIGLLNKAAPVTGPRPELDPDIVAELDDVECDEDYVPHEDFDEFPDDFVSILNAEGDAIDHEQPADEPEFSGIRDWLYFTETCRDMPPLEQFEDADEDNNFNSYRDVNRFEIDCEGSENSMESEGNFAVSDEEEEEDNVGSLPLFYGRRGPKSSASRTSASSATVPRSELLSRLDERFEKMFSEEYADDQLGALDDAVIEGACDVDSEAFQQAVKTTWKQLEKNRSGFDGDEKDRTISWVRQNLENRAPQQNEDDIINMEVSVKSKPAFDCESILSTYSNTRNRPHLIDDSHLFKKTPKLTMRALKEHNRRDGNTDDVDREMDEATLLTCISSISFRPKNETADERRDRKTALRELRKERRKEKKINKLAFKEELKKQKIHHINQTRNRVVPVV